MVQSKIASRLSDRALDVLYRKAVKSYPKAAPLEQLHLIHNDEQLTFFHNENVIYLDFTKPCAYPVRGES